MTRERLLFALLLFFRLLLNNLVNTNANQEEAFEAYTNFLATTNPWANDW